MVFQLEDTVHTKILGQEYTAKLRKGWPEWLARGKDDKGVRDEGGEGRAGSPGPMQSLQHSSGFLRAIRSHWRVASSG